MLLGETAKNLGSTKLYEISLEPLQGFDYPTPTNSVQEGRLARYNDSSDYPNVAVISVPVTLKEILSALDRFKMQRAILDAVDLMVRWLAFAWGLSRSANPLLDGVGISSAAMLEIAIGCSGIRFDTRS